MSKIGNTPTGITQSFPSKQNITGNGGTSYTLNHTVTQPEEIEVFINNVRQNPGAAYTVAGTNLTFASALDSTDSCYAIFQNNITRNPAQFDVSRTVNTLNATTINASTFSSAATFSSGIANAGTISAGTFQGSLGASVTMPAGSVLQVVHGRLSSTLVATGSSGASDYIVDIGLSASITPKFSTSNILINVNLYVGADQTNASGYQQSYFIYKNGSELDEVNGDEEGGRQGVAGAINMYDPGGANQTMYQIARLGGTHMDYAVGATSAQTYSVRTRSYTSGPTIYINRSQQFQSQGTNYDHVPQSTITLTEIAA